MFLPREELEHNLEFVQASRAVVATKAQSLQIELRSLVSDDARLASLERAIRKELSVLSEVMRTAEPFKPVVLDDDEVAVHWNPPGQEGNPRDA